MLLTPQTQKLHFSLKCCITALPEFNQLLDFFNLFDSRRAVATFEATEAAASVVFRTVASVKTVASTSQILQLTATIILP